VDIIKFSVLSVCVIFFFGTRVKEVNFSGKKKIILKVKR